MQRSDDQMKVAFGSLCGKIRAMAVGDVLDVTDSTQRSVRTVVSKVASKDFPGRVYHVNKIDKGCRVTREV